MFTFFESGFIGPVLSSPSWSLSADLYNRNRPDFDGLDPSAVRNKYLFRLPPLRGFRLSACRDSKLTKCLSIIIGVIEAPKSRNTSLSICSRVTVLKEVMLGRIKLAAATQTISIFVIRAPSGFATSNARGDLRRPLDQPRSATAHFPASGPLRC